MAFCKEYPKAIEGLKIDQDKIFKLLNDNKSYHPTFIARLHPQLKQYFAIACLSLDPYNAIKRIAESKRISKRNGIR